MTWLMYTSGLSYPLFSSVFQSFSLSVFRFSFSFSFFLGPKTWYVVDFVSKLQTQLRSDTGRSWKGVKTIQMQT